MYIISQVISFVVWGINIAIAQMKDVKYVLLGEVIGNLLLGLSYTMLGGLSGGWVCLVAAVQTIILFFTNNKDISSKAKNVLLIVFAAIYVIGTVVVYQGWGDIISCACAIVYVLAIMQTDTAKYRKYKVLNSFLWTIYDIKIAAFASLLMHGSILISLVVGMIRLDRKQEK